MKKEMNNVFTFVPFPLPFPWHQMVLRHPPWLLRLS